MNDTRSGSSVLLRRASVQRLFWAAAPATLLAVAALGIVPSTSHAADAPSTAPANSDALEEVIVTATRKSERLLDIPVSTSVLTPEALDIMGAAGQDIRELAFSVPSLNIESSNGRTFPRFYIRGYGNTDFTNFASQPVGLYYDDIVQENPSLKGFPVFDQADVEVLRGPQGTLFGRNSPAGVVKFESAKPVLGDFSGSASISDGTYNTLDVNGVVNAPVSDTMALRLAVQGQHRDNWVYAPMNPAGDQHLEGYDDWAARLQLLVKPGDNFTALFNAHARVLDGSARLFRANMITPGTDSIVPGFDPALIDTDGYNGQSYTSVGGNVHLTWNTPDFTYQSISGYESIKHYVTEGDIDGGYGLGAFVGPGPSGPGFIPFFVQTSGGVKEHYQLTQEFRAVSSQPGPLQGQMGVFFFYEDITAFSNNYLTPDGLGAFQSTVSRQKNDAEAAFGSLEYSFTSALKIRAGLRFTQDHKDFSVPFDDSGLPLPYRAPVTATARRVNWDVSPTFQIAPDVNLYARVATGFRAPSFGAPSVPSLPTLPNGLPVQVARAEDNISYETGIKANMFEHRASIAFDIYYFDVSNQQLTAVGGNGTNAVSLINAKDTIGKGAELDFEVRPLPNLTMSLSGAYNYTRIDSPGLAVSPCFNFGPGLTCTELNPLNAQGLALVNGNPLPEAPKYTGDFSLRYGVPVAAGSEAYLYTDMSYRSEMNFFLDEEREFTGPAMYQLGVRLGYSWDNKKYEVAAFCRNCTNEIRVTGGINFENFTGFINDPRIVGGQFTMKF
jgi:iron complex outermembrane receptor protein